MGVFVHLKESVRVRLRRFGLEATDHVLGVAHERTRSDILGNLAFYAGFIGFLVFATMREADEAGDGALDAVEMT